MRSMSWPQRHRHFSRRGMRMIPSPISKSGTSFAHLRAKLAKGEINEVSAVFELTERLLGNDEVEPGFITIGLFENVQNTSANTGIDQEAWEPFLGPLFRGLWDALNNFWGGSTTSPSRTGRSRRIVHEQSDDPGGRDLL